MTYYVNLGGILLYGIKNVEDNSEREITSYDGIGQGFFPVPESRKLRTWTFECEMTEQNRNRLANWTAASKVFTGFEVLLATKDPSRFIFVSNNRNESMSGFLTGYSKKEEYPGVYNVTVKVTEYKAAGVKTTDVPYIKRPGKAPALPKVVVFDNRNTPYSQVEKNKKGGGSDNTNQIVYGPQEPSFSIVGGSGGSSASDAGRSSNEGKSTNVAAIIEKQKYTHTISNSAVYENWRNTLVKVGGAIASWSSEQYAKGNLWDTSHLQKIRR